MRRLIVAGLAIVPALSAAQSTAKFPPDSLVNTRVIAHGTPVGNVVGVMKNFTQALGVRCQYCHVGVEGQPLTTFDFVTDEKRTKIVARQMMVMLQDINRRIDSLPGRVDPSLKVTCTTCHRGRTNPLALDSAAVKPPLGEVSSHERTRKF
jgi:hypothetical protein